MARAGSFLSWSFQPAPPGMPMTNWCQSFWTCSPNAAGPTMPSSTSNPARLLPPCYCKNALAERDQIEAALLVGRAGEEWSEEIEHVGAPARDQRRRQIIGAGALGVM